MSGGASSTTLLALQRHNPLPHLEQLLSRLEPFSSQPLKDDGTKWGGIVIASVLLYDIVAR